MATGEICPTCASDCVSEEGLASDDESPAAEAYENYSCSNCGCRWIHRARLTWYETEITHEPSREGKMVTIKIMTCRGAVKSEVEVERIGDCGLRTHSDGERTAGRSHRRIAIDADGVVYDTRPGSGHWRVAPAHHIDGARAVLDREGN